MQKLLTDDQTEHRIEVRLEMKNRIFNNSNFIKSFITADETWALGYDSTQIGTKRLSIISGKFSS